MAKERGFRRVFENDPDIGGRYSVLSYFGLVPAALMGVNIEALLHRAQVAEQNCTDFDASGANSGLWLGVAMGELALQGRDKLTFVVSEPISSFGLWVEQLIAESTGKEGKGILPVADEPLGDPDAYGDDRVFAYLRNADEPDEDLDAKMDALAQAGHPVITLAGRTAPPTSAGSSSSPSSPRPWRAGCSGINPFDQPNVQEAKDNTAKVLEMPRAARVPDAGDEALSELLGDAAPPHYVAIMGYVSRRRSSTRPCRAARARSATTPRPPPRSATARASCTPPASSTRAARRRAVPAARARRRRGRGDARAPDYTFGHAEERPGRRRPPDAARPRPAGRAGAAGGRPGGGAAGADRAGCAEML